MDLDTIVNSRYAGHCYPMRNILGKEVVTVTVSTKGDPHYQIDVDDGTLIEAGISLDTLRPDPHVYEVTALHLLTGTPHVLSLKEWANADPETTYILIDWGFKPNRASEHVEPAACAS